MEWGRDACLKLIECYKARPMLWNFKDPKYYNKSAKMLAWEEVGQEMGKNAEECRKKMVSLDSSFRREKSRICRTKRCGKVYEPSWFAFKSLLFLYDKGSKKKPPANLPKYVKRKTSSIVVSDVKTRIKTEIDVNNSNEEMVEFENDSAPLAENELVSELVDQNRISSGEDNIIMFVNESDSNCTSDLPEFSNVEVISEPNQGRMCCSGETDECRSFGIFIGNKLRNYPKDTRNMVQHAISNVIFSADQGHFDARATYSTPGYT